MKSAIFGFFFLVLCASHPIKNVVVLMMENRSFDHMLGYMKNENREINGLDGTECNRFNTTDPNSIQVCVSPDAEYVDPDPAHSVPTVAEQVFGELDCRPDDDCFVNPPPMNGFVQSAERRYPNWGENIMKCFNPADVPVISELTREFVVFDEWYSSIPGNTMPNRFYMMSGTSAGMSNNDVIQMALGLDLLTLFEILSDNDYTWKNYFQEGPTALLYKWTRRPKNWENFKHYTQFLKDAQEGNLPNFSMIDPRYFDLPNTPANDDHPSHDVSEGQKLMKEVYESIRNGPQWNETLLLITYDEHGGFYDHHPTPLSVPNPDGIESESPYVFDFERLGVRVPTIAISPWVQKGGVIHRPPLRQRPYENSEYDHTSIYSTLRKIFDLEEHMTDRDEWAGTFEHIFDQTSPRTDCPEEIPGPTRSLRKSPAHGMNVISELQKQLVWMASDLTGEGLTETDIAAKQMTVNEGSRYIKERVNEFFGKNMYEGTPDDIY